MLITGARISIDANTTAEMDLWVDRGRVSLSPISTAEWQVLDGAGFLILPGLINAHDHLELNLFPRLGRGPYVNASAWAQDIYRPLEPPVKQHLAVPKAIRLSWGAIKNVLSGVTTVAHHNALHPIFFHSEFPVRVVRRYGWAHSLRFSPDCERRFRMTPAEYPFIIHAAEGVDESARVEIHAMAKAGLLASSTVLVHGVGIGREEISLLTRTGASIVWCPSSNRFTLGRSLDRAVLNSEIPCALGSDSAMTAEGDLLDELQVARQFVDDRRLYAMVTTIAARILKLPNGYGRISHDGPADLVMVRDYGLTPAETLLTSYPELVMIRGRVVLISSGLAGHHQLNRSLRPLSVESRGQYLCGGQVRTLFAVTKKALGETPRLAGKALAA